MNRARKPDESFEQYRAMQRVEGMMQKARLKGKVVWPGERGTLVVKKDMLFAKGS